MSAMLFSGWRIVVVANVPRISFDKTPILISFFLFFFLFSIKGETWKKKKTFRRTKRVCKRRLCPGILRQITEWSSKTTNSRRKKSIERRAIERKKHSYGLYSKKKLGKWSNPPETRGVCSAVIKWFSNPSLEGARSIGETAETKINREQLQFSCLKRTLSPWKSTVVQNLCFVSLIASERRSRSTKEIGNKEEQFPTWKLWIVRTIHERTNWKETQRRTIAVQKRSGSISRDRP